jgi:predicted transcriptional regulator
MEHTAIIYQPPKPCGMSLASIDSLAAKVGKKLKFLPGEDIEILVKRLKGAMELEPEGTSMDSGSGSILVHGFNESPRFTIYISRYTGPLRDRFTAAHEIGHYILHSNVGETPLQASRYGRGAVETEANTFAAGLLMPREEFTAVAKANNNRLHALSVAFQVSEASAKVRLHQLGLL